LILDSATSLSWKQKILFPHPVSQSTKKLHEGIVAFNKCQEIPNLKEPAKTSPTTGIRFDDAL
jgi:hypothetical protein